MSLPPFVQHFAALADPRIQRTRRHLFLEILVIAFCAVLCGAEGWEDIEHFGLAKYDWLKERLGLTLPNGIPSDDTFRRVFSRLAPDAFGTCFRAWVATLHQRTAGEVIALDGKTLRHSFDTACGRGAIHRVSAWAASNALVLGAVKVDEKSNAITAVPALLALLDLTDCIVTADAMSCQKAIARQVIEQGGDYVFSLKGNQPHLSEDVAACLARLEVANWPDRAVKTYRGMSAGHGRIETRRIFCLTLQANDPLWQEVQQQWLGLRSLIKVERTRQIGKKISHETSYYISSLLGSAQQIGKSIRKHWQIENRLHYVLDVAMNEDACRIRADHAPQNFAVLRHTALNLLRRASGKMGIRAKQKKAGWDTDYLLHVLLN